MDKEFVLEAVKLEFRVLELVAEEFKRDREFVLEAVKHDVRALEFVAEELEQ